MLVALSDKGVGWRWLDCDHIRFQKGKPEKIGGWEKRVTTPLDSIARGAFPWTAINGANLIGVGTTAKVYSVDDMLQDITPLRASGTLGTDPFAVTNLSAVVIVEDVGHGLDVGAYVHFDDATAGGGITIDGEYQVASVVDDDHYTIVHSAAATSTDATTGGAAVTYEYEINPGLEDVAYGLGWGAGPFGEGFWGTPRDISDSVVLDLRTWFFGTRYDGHLLMMPFGGTLYDWDQPNAADRAEAVANAPANARAMFVTAEGFPFMLGTDTPMTVAWPDRDDITDWTPSALDTANIRRLKSGNKLMNGTAFGAINVIWSDTSLYLAQFLEGASLIYDTRVVGVECGLVGALAFAVAPDVIVWLSSGDIHAYSGGGVARAPRSQEIHDLLFHDEEESRRIDLGQASKIWGGYNRKFNEVWFGYVSMSATGDEPDRYVKVCLDDWSWDFGTLTRTGLVGVTAPNGDIVMFGTDLYIYNHEVGRDADGAALEAYIESGIVPLRSGDVDVDIDGFVPDFKRQAGNITLTVSVKERSMSAAILDSETKTIAEGDDLVDLHLGGRYAKIRIESDEVDGDFRLGVPQIEVGAAGQTR